MLALGYKEYGMYGNKQRTTKATLTGMRAQCTRAETGAMRQVCQFILFIPGKQLMSAFQLGLHVVTHYGHKHVKAWHTNMPMSVVFKLCIAHF